MTLQNGDYEDFTKLTKSVIDLSKTYNCPILSQPGGGYNNKTATECSIEHIELLRSYE